MTTWLSRSMVVALVFAVVTPVPGAGQVEQETAPSQYNGQRLTVSLDGSGDFDSIAAAVQAAEAGSQILVAPGTYPESVVIDKDISIIGERGARAVVGSLDAGARACGPREVPCSLWLDDADATVQYVDVIPPVGVETSVVVTGGSPSLKRMHITGDLELRGGTDARVRFVDVSGLTSVRDDRSSPQIARSTLGGLFVGLPATPSIFWNTMEHAWVRGAANFVRNSVVPKEGTPTRSSTVGLEIEDPARGLVVRDNYIADHVVGLLIKQGSGIKMGPNTLQQNGVGLKLDQLGDLDTSSLIACKNDVAVEVTAGPAPPELRELCSSGG